MGFSTSIAKHIRSNTVGYVAVFLALTGTAAALPGTNSVDSGDIINGQVKTPDLGLEAVKTARLAPNSVNGAKVVDGSLTGTDIADASLVDSNIAPETLTGREVRDGFLTGADVSDNSLTGGDVQESTLETVPSASLAGIGRSASNGESSQGDCDPESSTFVTCVSAGLNLPARARVLLIGTTQGNV